MKNHFDDLHKINKNIMEVICEYYERYCDEKTSNAIRRGLRVDVWLNLCFVVIYKNNYNGRLSIISNWANQDNSLKYTSESQLENSYSIMESI
jgi:hypothetical protein